MKKSTLKFRFFIVFLACLLLLFPLTGCKFFPNSSAPEVPEGSFFEVHFIDVGQADAILVLCDGASMLIDGGNADDSDLIYTYLKNRNLSILDYVVCTHAHEDHVGGLPGALSYATAKKVYSPVTSYNSKAFSDFVKKAEAQGLSLTVPTVGESFSLGSSVVKILGPIKEYEETNDTSIVLRIDYGETSFLFTGDMEKDAEKDLLDAGADLRADVLKVGHHGSDTSSSYRFLREVEPTYGVISVGKDNSYGHPKESTLSLLRDADVKLYRTDLQGDIICRSDGKVLTFETKKNSDIQTNPTEKGTPSVDGYIGNTKSNIFHLPTCKNLPAEENRISFSSREDAVNAGYSPCGNCRP